MIHAVIEVLVRAMKRTGSWKRNWRDGIPKWERWEHQAVWVQEVVAKSVPFCRQSTVCSVSFDDDLVSCKGDDFFYWVDQLFLSSIRRLRR